MTALDPITQSEGVLELSKSIWIDEKITYYIGCVVCSLQWYYQLKTLYNFQLYLEFNLFFSGFCGWRKIQIVLETFPDTSRGSSTIICQFLQCIYSSYQP